MEMILAILMLLLAVIVVRVLYTLYIINCCSDEPMLVCNSVKTLIVLGSGGHTGEMLKIVKELDDMRYHPRVYIIASTDTVSEKRLKLAEEERKLKTEMFSVKEKYKVEVVPRSREVGQSWLSSIITTAWASVFSMLIVARHRPSLILINGPGTCVPICLAAFLLRVFAICQIRVVFIESLCRVLSLSLTGKILYRLVDDFFVQWPQLKEKYSRAIYKGRLV